MIANVMMACIILHMLIKDEEDLVLELIVKLLDNIQMTKGLTFAKYVENTNEIENQ